MRIETLAVHKGRMVDPSTRAVTPPLHMSTTFERDADGSYPQGYVYGRSDNPNRRLLEECVAALEAGEDAAAFFLRHGGHNERVSGAPSRRPRGGPAGHLPRHRSPAERDHGPLGPARHLRRHVGAGGCNRSHRGFDADVVHRDALQPVAEDYRRDGSGELRPREGIFTVCDNTWATPVLQRPLELGWTWSCTPAPSIWEATAT